MVVEFMRRKFLGRRAYELRERAERARARLAFVFAEVAEAQRFLICIELLIRRAQDPRNLPPPPPPPTL